MDIDAQIDASRLQLGQRTAVLNRHPVFQAIQSVEDLHTFMAWHVFAVWDFMSLLKRLQIEFSCTTLPWLPPSDPMLARLINEIVLGEETDAGLAPGSHMSHFELYLAAMREVQCPTRRIEAYVDAVRQGMDCDAALARVRAPAAVRRFVGHTLDVARHGDVAQVLGSFFHGRESVIPAMFRRIVRHLGISKRSCPAFVYYLKRHIELDGDEHGPAAERMLQHRYAADPAGQLRLLHTALASVNERIALWDALLKTLQRAQKRR